MSIIRVTLIRGEVPGTGEEPGLHTDVVYDQELREDVFIDSVEIFWDGELVYTTRMNKGPLPTPPGQEKLT